MEIPREQWTDMWESTQHLLASLIDVTQWNTYAIYKSQAGRQAVPKPKPIDRPKYGKQPEPKTARKKPTSLRELGGFMEQQFRNAQTK